MKTYNYIEFDDNESSMYGMTLDEVYDLIQDHNEYFKTNYKTIDEFNHGEELENGIRHIEINI